MPDQEVWTGYQHDDEAVPEGHNRQEALDAFPPPQNEGQAP